MEQSMAHHHVHYADDYESRHHSPHHHPHGSRARELLAGAAAFAAFHAFEAHQRAEGRHVSHPLAKELLAALVAAEVEKLIETKGREMFNEWTGFFEDAKARSHRLYWEKYERPHAVLEIEGGHEHGRPHGRSRNMLMNMNIGMSILVRILIMGVCRPGICMTSTIGIGKKRTGIIVGESITTSSEARSWSEGST
ncbi:LOW QUALITY PROTEIN: hypothetical protein Dda_4226 [Drechslerella dactyloides]|uniref:Uncharacterized protein n=1 Tax=Drechslerella dactyloides TaxID=74499 RepID=A0AAD6J3P3_DREDA|nr:LOW QUALITY PROTEIN: hypothetical protein Dda_4226 [Drechslerella dactyloides]